MKILVRRGPPTDAHMLAWGASQAFGPPRPGCSHAVPTSLTSLRAPTGHAACTAAVVRYR